MVSLNVVFLGSPEFAVPSLQALLRHPEIDVSLVVTQPDRPVGRGRKIQPPPVKAAGDDRGIPVFQPHTMRDDEAIGRLAAADPDVLVVVAYGEILRKRVLELPRVGCLNLHPSLLPRYRGSSPIPAAILNGDRDTGVSYMRLTRRMDAGPIVAQTTYPLSGTETTGSLTDELANIAASTLPAVLLDWASGRRDETPQDDSQATYTRELRKSDGQIDWHAPASYLERFVRAMNPWPAAWTLLGEQRLTIHASRVVDIGVQGRPGRVVLDDGAVIVQTGDGSLELLQVQPAGKRPMSAEDWARGVRLSHGSAFRTREVPGPPLIEER